MLLGVASGEWLAGTASQAQPLRGMFRSVVVVVVLTDMGCVLVAWVVVFVAWVLVSPVT